MTTNDDIGYNSICLKCNYRVIRVLEISDEDAEMFQFIEEFDEDDESGDDDCELKVVHEVCALLHVDLGFNVKSCNAFVPSKGKKPLINLDILKDI